MITSRELLEKTFQEHVDRILSFIQDGCRTYNMSFNIEELTPFELFQVIYTLYNIEFELISSRMKSDQGKLNGFQYLFAETYLSLFFKSGDILDPLERGKIATEFIQINGETDENEYKKLNSLFQPKHIFN
jgi:hypothetical protein